MERIHGEDEVMNLLNKRIKSIIAGFLLGISAGSPAFADDTEVFTAALSLSFMLVLMKVICGGI